MSHLQFLPTPLAGVILIHRSPREDSRGFFERLYCIDELRQAGMTMSIAQINRTLTKTRGAVRGLHFQHAPAAEHKVVSCLRGRVFDVAIDLRRGSTTFLQHFAVELAGDQPCSLLLPPGIAHGFQTLHEDCEMLYLHDQPYAPQYEGGVSIRDPRLGIAWPLEITQISERDAGFAMIDDAFEGITV
jgi:dTDP-4-dehydrorhamnose 3,5-epimerase